jgi:CheY-specific phosphatase CheX
MSSMTLSSLSDAESLACLASAVEAVAERSFYAVVDPCEERLFLQLGQAVPEWFVGTVHFADGPLAGSIACTLPADLALNLCEAFTGGDPQSAAPTNAQLADMVGELANMICGAWLSRVAGDCAFRLSPPVVARVRGAEQKSGARLVVAMSNRPVSIELLLAPVLEP